MTISVWVLILAYLASAELSHSNSPVRLVKPSDLRSNDFFLIITVDYRFILTGYEKTGSVALRFRTVGRRTTKLILSLISAAESADHGNNRRK